MPHDVETPRRIFGRFGIESLDEDPVAATTVMSMCVAGMTNPFTGAATVGPLAILVDAASGLANHLRRNPDEWSVSSELSLELSPDGAALATADPDVPVIADARVLGPKGSSSLSFCTLSCAGTIIGGATVRSYYLSADRVVGNRVSDTLIRTPYTPLSELMAVEVTPSNDGRRVLRQLTDPVLYNDVGIVHGGVSSAGLELAASAVISDDGSPLRTASVRVNFLRPFMAGECSRYEAAPLRIGRGTAVADAQAIDDMGRVALTARVTAYR
ncbi:phenylacetic acid degradation protein (plasmid) [Mycobacterium branderi]|uniref:Phenylacetic acid degradation protein n=1 Tax=Mycobacterium branderi TaxID=43348 RepID=A0ABN6BB34_9MYCO|nr:phenylacetic acid degradation protein [Mycobacterium branderi]